MKVELVVVGVIGSLAGVAAAGVASGSGAARSQIAIHEQGKWINDPTPAIRNTGTFTIELAGTTFGPAGKTDLGDDFANPKSVNGQEQSPLVGVDNLTSSKGKLELAYKGIQIKLNGKLSSSGVYVAPFARYGTWTVKSGTGIYAGWKGGGNWAGVAYGYELDEPYSVEWDGYITTP